MLKKKIESQSIKTVRWYQKEPDQALPIPVLGPDIMDPRQYNQIKEYALAKLEAQQASAQQEANQVTV